MDRGEDRDFLSSGFFDGSHGCLYNKRLIANDSNRKKVVVVVVGLGGGLLPFRCIQPYRCHVQETKTTRHICHLKPQTDNFTNKITA